MDPAHAPFAQLFHILERELFYSVNASPVQSCLTKKTPWNKIAPYHALVRRQTEKLSALPYNSARDARRLRIYRAIFSTPLKFEDKLHQYIAVYDFDASVPCRWQMRLFYLKSISPERSRRKLFQRTSVDNHIAGNSARTSRPNHKRLARAIGQATD